MESTAESLTGRPGDGVIPGAVAMSSMVEPDPRSFTAFQRFAMRAIAWYQRTFSFRPSPCRFTPSCSVYAAEAIAVHGARRGLWLSVRRLARCRPFGPSGWDPVPTPDRSPSSVEPAVAPGAVNAPSPTSHRPPRSSTKAR